MIFQMLCRTSGLKHSTALNPCVSINGILSMIFVHISILMQGLGVQGGSGASLCDLWGATEADSGGLKKTPPQIRELRIWPMGYGAS